MPTDQLPSEDRSLDRIILVLFVGLLAFHFWGARVGWESNNLPGAEFRQAQTALSTYYIKEDNNYSLAYPTPVLGPPWSIPMEFPLYQWTVAKVSSWTGMNITQAGRGVSLTCFYLTLPAVFMLLGHWQVPRMRRLLVLGLMLACPLYIFYARAFLIEMMALMFSLWFLVAFLATVKNGHRGWWVLANLMGMAAGMVKVTTFMLYLMPAGIWALGQLYQARATVAVPGWRRCLGIAGRIVGTTALPFVMTLWWLRFADATKALNPMAEFLISANLNGFNFGFSGARFSAEIWSGLWGVLQRTLVWPPLLALGLVLLAGWGRRWWQAAGVCAGTYVAVLLLFPQLYAWHDYYAVANGVLLLTVLGFGLVAITASRLPLGVKCAVLSGVFAGQIWLYHHEYYESQRGISTGGSGLSNAIDVLTQPDEVIVMVGNDWSSIVPYYARRRALMIRNGMEFDPAYMARAFHALKGWPVGLLVLPQERSGFPGLLEMAQQELGIDPRPVLEWHGMNVYLNAAKREHTLGNLRQLGFHEAKWIPGSEPRIAPLGDEWEWYDRIQPEMRDHFRLMEPRPIRFKTTYGIGLSPQGGQFWFNSHSSTRLRFALKAGAHRLRAEFMMDAGCYDARLKPIDMSDGVNMDIRSITKQGKEQLIKQRIFAPATQPEDRGPQVVEVPFQLDEDAEVEILIGPGPNGSAARDWALLGAIKFD